MTPERMQQVEDLYHAALECERELRATFLKEACGGDEALRCLLEPVDGAYRERLEAVGFADAVIVIAAEER